MMQAHNTVQVQSFVISLPGGTGVVQAVQQN